MGSRRLFLLVALVFATAGFDLDENELHCEEAVAHLMGCCPDFDPTKVDCNHGFCASPDLTGEQAECIQAMECEEVRAQHLCERVPGHSDDAGPAGVLVCE